MLDTLHERVGEEARGGASPSPYNNGTWGRIIGQHGDRDGDSNGVLGSGPKFDFDFLALQVGQDIYRAQGPSGWRTHEAPTGDRHGAWRRHALQWPRDASRWR